MAPCQKVATLSYVPIEESENALMVGRYWMTHWKLNLGYTVFLIHLAPSGLAIRAIGIAIFEG